MLQAILLQCSCVIPSQPTVMGCVFSHSAVMISLIWAISLFICVVSVLFYLHQRNVIKKEMAAEEHKHEQTMKDKAFQQEKEWAHFNEHSANTVDALKKRIEKMEQAITKLENELSHENNNSRQ